jgi:hypothetical protein
MSPWSMAPGSPRHRADAWRQLAAESSRNAIAAARLLSEMVLDGNGATPEARETARLLAESIADCREAARMSLDVCGWADAEVAAGGQHAATPPKSPDVAE